MGIGLGKGTERLNNHVVTGSVPPVRLKPVVEKPKEGEYRYLRFAWKKPDGTGVMLQLCAGGTDWGRYFFVPVGAATGFNRGRKNVPTAALAFRKLARLETC